MTSEQIWAVFIGPKSGGAMPEKGDWATEKSGGEVCFKSAVSAHWTALPGYWEKWWRGPNTTHFPFYKEDPPGD